MGKIDIVLEKSRKILKADTRGLTIQEIAEKTNVSRVTATIALSRLLGAGLVDVRTIGNCRLHYWRKK
ncbi:MAG: MarR family transcriptional regulator [Nanoarchaeota archaeon]|nr:MarR family transcriptional regulator [Nanoarchaeota archaeon]